MKIYFDPNQFPAFPFCGPHPKPCGERGVGKHYHIPFGPELGHDICAIRRIPCACVACTSILEKPWLSGIPSKKQARYQPVTNYTYWPVLGSYNNCNIIELTPKSIPFEAFDEIHKVVIDGIIENVAPLVQSGMYGAINTDDTQQMYYISFISSWRHIRCKIIQQLTDKLFLLANYFSRHNIFAPCNKTPIGIGNNNHCNRLS